MVRVVEEEKVVYSNNISKRATPTPQVQGHTTTSISSGSVVNFSDGESNITINFNYHYTNNNFMQFGILNLSNGPKNVRSLAINSLTWSNNKVITLFNPSKKYCQLRYQ